MEVVALKWTKSGCAPLPLELWERIIAEIDDSRYLPRVWLNFRRVSHSVKAATEHVFATKHLPKSHIEFRPMVLRDAGLGTKPEVVEISLAFDSLSPDGSRAKFVAKKSFENLKNRQMSTYVDGATETVYDRLVKTWERSTHGYRQSCPSVEHLCPPRHCIVMYGDVNDTELSGVEIDLEHFAASVLWKPMLSMFYGEIEYEKWANKVLRQHAARSEYGFMPQALQLGEAMKGNDRRLVQELLRVVMAKAEMEERKKTKTIRTMRYKRLLGKMDYREKGQDLKGFFEMAARPSLVESVKYSLKWDHDEDEDSHAGDEKGDGCFYDGMGMEFDGKRELNKLGEFSDDEDEWLDEEDSDDKTVK